MLRNPLNKVNGNWRADKEDNQKLKDLYHCDLCKEDVTEDKYNFKKECCYQCWLESDEVTKHRP